MRLFLKILCTFFRTLVPLCIIWSAFFYSFIDLQNLNTNIIINGIAFDENIKLNLHLSNNVYSYASKKNSTVCNII